MKIGILYCAVVSILILINLRNLVKRIEFLEDVFVKFLKKLEDSTMNEYKCQNKKCEYEFRTDPRIDFDKCPHCLNPLLKIKKEQNDGKRT